MRVIQTITGTMDGCEPVEITYFKGDNLASALAALVQAAAQDTDDTYYTVNSVRIEF